MLELIIGAVLLALIGAALWMARQSGVSSAESKGAARRENALKRFIAARKETSSMQEARENAARRRRERDESWG